MLWKPEELMTFFCALYIMKIFHKIIFSALLMLASGCATQSQVPRSEADFRLFVDVTPKEAIILVDDVIVGNGEHTTEVPLKLQAGTRRIAILSPGYYPFKTTLEYIQPNETYTLKTRLITEEF